MFCKCSDELKLKIQSQYKNFQVTAFDDNNYDDDDYDDDDYDDEKEI